MESNCDRKEDIGRDDRNLTLIGQMISSRSSDKSSKSKKHYFLGKLFGPFSFINISGGKDELENFGHESRKNMVEVAVLMNILQRLHKEWQCHSQKLSVCVVCPYLAQFKEIEKRLGKRYEKLGKLELKMRSVEGCQGSEADVVIVSTVRSNSVRSVEFVLDHSQANCVMTKARQCLWILGNAKTLVEADCVWEGIVSDAKECNWFINAEEDDEIAQVIIDVKSKLDELEALLDKKSIIFEATRWKVVFSEIFVKSFSKLPSTYSKKLVIKFLLKLANGWRPKNKKTDVLCETSVRIAKQFKVEDRYIICTNDISNVPGYATQILKVWDILQLNDVPALVSKLAKIYGAFSDDFLRCCKQKCLEGSLEIPMCYTSFDVSRYKGTNSAGLTSSLKADNAGSFVEDAKVNESLLLIKFYSLSAGIVSQLMSSSDGTVMNVPFEVSNEERQIILNERSTFILGRSGTGKTTVLVMKMFQKEQQHHMASEGLNDHYSLISGYPDKNQTSIRQLFVTVNPKLCFAVKEHINNLRRFVHGDNFDAGCFTIDGNDMDEYEKFKDIPDSFEEIPSDAYPLVISFNMFLLMLDRTIGSSYFDRFPDIRKIRSKETASSRLVALTVWRKQVTYEKFRTSYWPRLNFKFRRGLDPLRVFTEIISCIKGGLHFRESDAMKLSLQSYLQLSKRRVSSFSEDEREMIYKIYEDYEKRKIVQGEFDLSDLVNDLLHRFKCVKYEGEFMDFVYIDEAQDLTMKQLALFKYISKNVEEGFVFAGDTAQTIARGVSFRFEDIKCLFYKEFLNRVEDKGIVSPIFNLSQNFRTHSGIVNLAQSVIELIYYFFPNFIDPLKPETSLLCGELPILLDCGTREDALIEFFQDKESHGGKGFSFGSEQVIMVRDDYARDKMANNIGRHALVMTIFECKGLEFEDVLLYNFFGSSPLKEQWRVIYEYLEEKHCLMSSETYPSFTNLRHGVLCYELKQLYVAITRTRQRLWICEDSEWFSSPMADYWRKLNLVKIEPLDDSFAQNMRVASSLKDWRYQGMKMLEVRNYKAATQCFEHANDFHWKAFARACELREAAHNLRGLRLEKSLEMFREAAGIFKNIEKMKKAAECFIDAGDYEIAGELYYGESDLKRAGECFILAGCHEHAAEVYAEGCYFHECLYACSEGKLFNLGLQYIRSWKQQDIFSKTTKANIDLIASEQKFLHKCALASHKQLDKEAMMIYVKDFSSLESMRNFLKDLGCFDELIELELEYGNHREAAKVARQVGNIDLEADILEKGEYFHDACQLYLAYVFASSLWADGSKGWPLKDFPFKNDLLSKAKTLACKCSPHIYEVVRKNIQLLSSEDLNLLELEELFAHSVKHKNIRGEILSARRILDRLLAVDASMYLCERLLVEKLIYYWNCLKAKMETMFEFLESLKVQRTRDFEDSEDFGLEYLGVRKQPISQDASYSLLYPNAAWVRRSGKMETIGAEQLAFAAKSYWCAEILSVGMKLLERLDYFRCLAAKNSFPLYQICESLICILEAAQFLLKPCRYLERTDVLLMNYIDLSSKEYFLHVFSLYWSNTKKLLSSDLSFRSKASRNLVKKVMLESFKDEIVDRGASPTLPQVIQVAVMLLGSSWQTNRRYHEIARKIDTNSSWNVLIKDLLIDDTLQTSYGTMQLVQHLCNALREAYNSRSNTSPSCFVYLLNRLLVLVSCFNGCLYATRSSVTEWLVHLNWNVSKEASGFNSAGSLYSVRLIYDFLAYTVHEILINNQGTEEWILKAGFDLKKTFPLLTLKLLVLMCLICLNSANYLDLLNDVLSKSDIIAFLPTGFSEVLFQGGGSTFLSVLAEALQEINDPLVVIRNAEVCPPVHARCAIFLNVFDNNGYKILEKLFPLSCRN